MRQVFDGISVSSPPSSMHPYPLQHRVFVFDVSDVKMFGFLFGISVVIFVGL